MTATTNVLIDFELSPDDLAKLQSMPDINVTPRVQPVDEQRSLPVELIKDKHLLLCELPPENVHDMQALELIQISSSGYSQLFNLGLVERGVRACNARGVFDVPIAEWNMAMMVNLVRDLRGMIRNQDQGIWDRSSRFQRELRGAVVGIWGYGGIGRETARLCHAMGLRVHVLNRRPVGPRAGVFAVPGTGDADGVLPDQTFTTGEEMSFLAELDFLILAMPLSRETEGIVGERELRALPNHAYLLNPARGPLVQQEALLQALREQWIAGAALDTHYLYPLPADHPLWSFPNVIMTPHISGSSLSQHYAQRVAELFAENVRRFQSKEPLLNELTTEQLSGG